MSPTCRHPPHSLCLLFVVPLSCVFSLLPPSAVFRYFARQMVRIITTGTVILAVKSAHGKKWSFGEAVSPSFIKELLRGRRMFLS